jgi:hypothetical protein
MGWVPFELRANGPGVGMVLLRGKLLPFASDSVSEVPFVAATKYIRQAPDAVGNRNFAAIRCCCDEPYIPVVKSLSHKVRIGPSSGAEPRSHEAV